LLAETGQRFFTLEARLLQGRIKLLGLSSQLFTPRLLALSLPLFRTQPRLGFILSPV